ncbi:hypothetical protein J6590_073045 [Homalodisca vitripennis]|nr:hypothetical protein J6590_073045 [Homalodisca vitripennis]
MNKKVALFLTESRLKRRLLPPQKSLPLSRMAIDKNSLNQPCPADNGRRRYFVPSSKSTQAREHNILHEVLIDSVTVHSEWPIIVSPSQHKHENTTSYTKFSCDSVTVHSEWPIIVSPSQHKHENTTSYTKFSCDSVTVHSEWPIIVSPSQHKHENTTSYTKFSCDSVTVHSEWPIIVSPSQHKHENTTSYTKFSCDSVTVRSEWPIIVSPSQSFARPGCILLSNDTLQLPPGF